MQAQDPVLSDVQKEAIRELFLRNRKRILSQQIDLVELVEFAAENAHDDAKFFAAVCTFVGHIGKTTISGKQWKRATGPAMDTLRTKKRYKQVVTEVLETVAEQLIPLRGDGSSAIYRIGHELEEILGPQYEGLHYHLTPAILEIMVEVMMTDHPK